MKTILLSGGGSTDIDDEDLPLVSGRSWRLRKDGRADAKINGKRVLIHRWITGANRNEQVDHKDGNPLNNTRDNLRICSAHDNNLNQVGKPNNRGCKFKGVSRKNGGFVANIQNKKLGGNFHIGWFKSQTHAAIAYDIFCKTIHGHFSRLNIPNPDKEEFDLVSSIINSPKGHFTMATSKFVGVGWKKRSNKWRARIRGKDIGYFDSELEAAVAYNQLAISLGLPVNKL